MIKTILLATDLGASTSHLLQHGTSLSKHYQARLIIVHAVEPLGTLGHALLQTYLKPELTEKLTTSGMDTIVQQIRFSIIDALTDEYMSGDIDLPRLGEVIVRPGNPVDVILDSADEIGADLLVVGSHSVAGLGDHHLGSVAQKILCMSRSPVYIVPQVNAIWRFEETRQENRI